MLRNTHAVPTIADAQTAFDRASPLSSEPGALSQTVGISHPHAGAAKRSVAHVEISPSGAVERRSLTGRGIRAELVQSMSRNRIEFRYRGTSHLILAYEHGVRRGGETFVAGMSPSTLRDFTRKLTFLPAGHDYFEWHQLHTSVRLLYVYFDPVQLDVQTALTNSSGPLNPRVFFEDASLWSTVDKLKGVIGGAGGESLPVAGLLIAAVTEVLLVNDDRQAKFAGDGDGVVAAAVVDEDDLVDRAFGNVADGAAKRGGRVVGGHDGNRPSRTRERAGDGMSGRGGTQVGTEGHQQTSDSDRGTRLVDCVRHSRGAQWNRASRRGTNRNPG